MRSAPLRCAGDLGEWRPVAPTRPERLIVVAPHPDDEVLGAGMTMRWCASAGVALVVVACTDGEASHRRSSSITPEALRTRRRAERSTAFAHLGLDPAVRRLDLGDGKLDASVPRLAEVLAAMVTPETALLVPWEHDDHPDHEAVSRAGRLAADATGAALWQAVIWGKVRRLHPYRGRQAHLHLSTAARAVKEEAARSFVSQMEAVGPGADDGPVVRPDELEAMLDGTEVILW